jgi:hypothetical protein
MFRFFYIWIGLGAALLFYASATAGNAADPSGLLRGRSLPQAETPENLREAGVLPQQRELSEREASLMERAIVSGASRRDTKRTMPYPSGTIEEPDNLPDLSLDDLIAAGIR